MSQVKVQGNASGTGVVTVTSPNTNSNFSLTLPAETGTLLSSASNAGFPAGSVIQIATSTLDGTVTASTGGAPNVITNGAQIFSVTFTPKRSNSVLWAQTSTVAISEEANNGDICWVSLWDDSTFISANSATWLFNKFTNNFNAAYTSLNDGWQVSNANTRTITVRAGLNAAGTVYINGNSTYVYTGASARIRLIVWEIAV